MNRWSISLRTSLICVTAFLTCLGLLAIYASSSIPAHGAVGDEFLYFRKQMLVAIFGFLVIFCAGHIPLALFERIVLPLFLLSALALAIIHVPGMAHSAKGATRWLRIGPIGFQPAELAKLATIFFMARILSDPRRDIRQFRTGILPALLGVGVLSLLLLSQPDFGTAMLLLMVGFLMVFVAGMPRQQVFALGIAGLLAAAATILAAPYRVKRILTFLNPWAEVRGSGFQIIQSFVGFQKGGLLGVGLGESRQKLFFLPDAHTDFILAVIGEELGLFGVLLVCSCFAFYVYVGFRIISVQHRNFFRFLALGITTLVALQASFNMGVTMGLLPTKGIPLPFVSSGASSLLCFLCATAVLARLSQEESAHASS